MNFYITPYMKLEKLYKELSTNPKVIKDIEIEIDALIKDESLDKTFMLFKSNIVELRIYALKIIEERLKYKKSANLSLDMEISAMKSIILIDTSDKTAEVFAKLGIYEWPKTFIDFFQIIIDLISNKQEMGYKILYNFLYLLNYSQEINDKRKNELKRAVGMIYKGYMQLFEDSFASIIIPILTESLKILPKDFDYSIIYRRGYEFPNKTIEFINDMGNLLNLEDVIELSSKMPVSVGMLIYFSSLKNKAPKTSNVTKMYEYVFKGLRGDLSTFILSIEFWTKFFCLKNQDQFVEQVLTEVLYIFVNLDEQNRLEVESEVYGLYNVLVKNYSAMVFTFIKKNGDLLPKRLCLFFIKKIYDTMQKNNLEGDMKTLVFKNPLLNGTILELSNDVNAVECIQFLDFSDKDSEKLCIRIINKFAVNEFLLNQIIERCIFKDKENANELIVECCIKLGKIETFEEPWDKNKFIRFFYYLKYVPLKVIQYTNSYLKAFIEHSPFDRCFSILKMLNNVPKEVYEKIYEDIFRYPYEDLNCFNRDLLIFFELQDPFIRREIDRILYDWNILDNTDSLILCTRSLISVFSEGVNKSNTTGMPFNSINSLFDLLRIEDPGIIRKICDVFYSYKGRYDVKKALYFLLVNYNSSHVEASHINISAALTKCIKEEGGAEALNEILSGIPLDNCINLRTECLQYNTKRGQMLVRNFLHNFKGKPLNTLYEDNFKVTEQNFINSDNKKTKGIDFQIDRTFFG